VASIYDFKECLKQLVQRFIKNKKEDRERYYNKMK
jgi:hypothetical protein